MTRFKTTWAAAVFGLLVGTTMVYVPHEFGAAVYRYIYDYTRSLGAGFLAGSLLVGLAALYPTLPRLVDVLGRLALIAAMAIYWFSANVLIGSVTGTVVYPVLIVGVVAEALPFVQRRVAGTFMHAYGAMAVALGALLVGFSDRIPVDLYRPIYGALVPLGAAFGLLGAGLLWALVTRRERLVRLLAGALLVPYLVLGSVLVLARAWAGAALYASVVGVAAVFVARRRIPAVGSIRWRLWRGMIVAACIPLLVLGALACVLMQRAIESQALEDANDAVAAEVEWLEGVFESQKQALASHAALESFRQAVRARDAEVLALSFQVLGFRSAGFEAVYLADQNGNVIAQTTPTVPSGGSVADRTFFRTALDRRFFVSRPYRAEDGESRVALAVGMRDQDGPIGVLVGTLSVSELSRRSSAVSKAYAIRVIDRRDGSVLRATRASMSDWVPPEVASGLAMADHGDYVGADDRNRQVLVSWARVPNTEWLVVASQDVADAFAFVTQLGAGAVAVVTAAALLALLLSQLVAHEVTRRMRRVREAAEALSRGEMQRRVEPEGNDELTTLAASFNRMADQIQAAQTQLQSAVQVRDEFLSMASHELRTPLTPLKVTAQTLRRLLSRPEDGLDRSRLLSMLDRVDRQAERLAMLVGDMLDTSRIQSGSFSLEPAPMDLSELVRDVVERSRSVNEQNAARLRAEVPEGAVQGVWDAARLEQVVVNLVENALRYAPQGGEILVRLEDLGGAVHLSVRDDGIGIPPESLDQLFQPYFRASNAAARHYGGLGLGLHICKEIVTRHGGRIWAESDGPGKGSCFHVELPRTIVRAAGRDRAA